MKQLSLYVSTDLESRAVDALERAGVEGFVRIDNATANKFDTEDRLSRTLTWEAIVLIAPGADDRQTAAVVDELETYANACETRPCLRIVISSVDAVY